MIHIALSASPFDPWQYLADWQAQSALRAGQFGATAVFVGTMRDFNDGVAVQAMNLEHYPGMTEYQLQRIAETAWRQWPVLVWPGRISC